MTPSPPTTRAKPDWGVQPHCAAEPASSPTWAIAGGSRMVSGTRSTGGREFDAKHSLGFILNLRASVVRDPEVPDAHSATSSVRVRDALTSLVQPKTLDADAMTTSPASVQQPPLTRARTRSKSTDPSKAATKGKTKKGKSPKSKSKESNKLMGGSKPDKMHDAKRLARKCTVDDCMSYTINKGLCFRHGGGKKCTFEDCNASAKISGLCWKHGGSIQCVVDGCDRRGKSRGLCWAHGGGTKCQTDSCSKVAVSNRFCWAHGGGKRCLFADCERPAYQRTLNYCPKHFKRFENGEEILEL